jgi:AcrR family transcriptional regulator
MAVMGKSRNVGVYRHQVFGEIAVDEGAGAASMMAAAVISDGLCHMARWAPDARGRLQVAAMELYGKHGFDSTTVTEIAERAGLTERDVLPALRRQA